mgnify:CR=1 FL=1
MRMVTGGVEMRKKSVLLASVGLVLLVGLIGTAVVLAQGGEDWQQPVESEVGSQPVEEATEETHRTSEVSIPDGMSAKESAKVASQIDTGSTVTMEALVQNWEQNLLGKEGWLHLKGKHYVAREPGSTLPNGAPLPEIYISESWYNLDEMGNVHQALSLMLDESGREIQRSMFKEGQWENITLQTKAPSSGDHRVHVDFGVLQKLEIARELELDVREWTESVGDTDHFVVAIEQELDAPVKVLSCPEPVEGSEFKATFDSQTGQLLYTESTLLTSSGSRFVSNRLTLLMAEMMPESSLPVEVNRLFAEE